MAYDQVFPTGSTSKMIEVMVRDSATGMGKTGLAYSSVSYAYWREGAATGVNGTCVSASLGTWTSAGWVEVDSTNRKGLYQFGVPDAALASGAAAVTINFQASGMIDKSVRIVLSSPTRGLASPTALPDASAEAAGGLYTRGTGAGQINQPANGQIDIALKAILGTALTEDVAGWLAAGFKKFFNVATPALTVSDPMRGTDNAALASNYTAARATNLDNLSAGPVAQATVCTETRLAQLDAANMPASQTTILNRIGAFTGSGWNTILGFFRALLRKDIGVTLPTDIGGTFDNTTDSTEAIRDRIENTGTGAYTITITVTDNATPPNNLESAKVRLTKGAETYLGTTNANGQVVFALDAGTWDVAITLPLYSFTPTTLVITGSMSKTYVMTAQSIPPSDPGFITGYCYCYDQNGNLLAGVEVMLELLAFLDTPDWDDELGVAGYGAPRIGTSDSSGLVTFTNMFTGVQYRIYGGTGAPRTFVVPSGATSPHKLPSIVRKV
jgi:hypothetical protein